MFRQRSLWPILCLLLATLLACSLGGTAAQVTPSSTLTATVAAVQEPTVTLPPAAPTQSPAAPVDQPTEPPLPTETAEPSATATRTPKPRLPAVTLRPRGTIAPLTVNYEVVKITRVEGDQALLTLKVIATGGRGGYLYYHDDVQQPSATFNIPGRCNKPFVHTIKVTSSDGQTAALPYHVGGLCPTPTP